MKQIKYFCNLCTEEKKHGELKCLFWDSTKVLGAGKFGGYILTDNLDSAHKHICTNCIKVISELI